MVSSETCRVACNLTHSDIDKIADGCNDFSVAGEVLRSYGPDLDSFECRNLLVYHIKAAVELGLPDHARRLFLALREFLDLHPELQSPNVTRITHS